jgi:hypothetical protein
MPEDLPAQSSIVRQFADMQTEAKINPPPQKPNMKTKKPYLKFLWIALGVIVCLLVAAALAGYFLVYRPGKRLMASVQGMQTVGNEMVASLKSQDLTQINAQLDKAKSQFGTIETDFQTFSWAKNLPIAKNYYADGERGITAGKEVLAVAEISLDAITPYADIIGLKGISSSGDGAKTTEDRIYFIINTLEKLQPQLESIGQHLETAKTQMDQIDPARYPEEIRGIAVRQMLTQAISLLDQAASLTNDARPLLESAPYMLGMDSPRKYLMIMQNDAELRPTGGFMTAYALVSISKGRFTILDSDDIYALDNKFTKKITAPAPILKYLPKVPYWNLRDMNLSPDLKVSMDTFYENYLTTRSPKVDGIITIDTQVMVDLLKITGKIGVPGYGNFSADIDPVCNCPQAFYALELYADVEGPVVWDSVSGRIIAAPENYGQRKSFIGPMAYSILTNVMAQPKTKMVDLFKTAINLIAEKHVQFYFTSAARQTAVESFNMAGRVREYPGDYLFVVDTNFAGAKTNTWVTYSADLKADVNANGTVTNTLTLTYKNPQEYFVDAKTNLKLNGIFRDWLRVYLPAGSQLIEAKGFESGQATGTDLGKTVVEGFFTVAPLNNKPIVIKYTSGYRAASPYRLLIQKQAGTKNFPYKVTVNNKTQPEIILDADKEISVSY